MFSSFWQQLLRAAFVANSSFIAQSFLIIPKSSLLYPYAVVVLVFCLSASLHAVGLWAIHPTCNVLPILKWYTLMGIAMVFEDVVKRMYWWIRGGQQGVDGKTSRWWRVFGYAWVWVYLGWSLPKLKFPMADCNYV